MQSSSRGVELLLVDLLADARDDNLPFKREVSCFITDNQGILSIVTENESGHVPFDFFGIWEQIKQSGPLYPKFVCMVHTHPDGMTKMSPTDWNMLHGWRAGLGVPVMYFVVTMNDYSVYVCDKENGKIVIKEVTKDYSNVGWNYLELIFDVLCGISRTEFPVEEEALGLLKEMFNTRNIFF